MSWHVSATFNGDSARRELDALRESVLAQNPEAGDQFEAARSAALGIILVSAVGWAAKCRFHVVMSGHANPDHAPRDGWANDMINVSVGQA